MKRNIVTFGVALGIMAALIVANTFIRPDWKTLAQQEEKKKAAEKVELAKAEEAKAKDAAKAEPAKAEPAKPADAPKPAAPAAPAVPSEFPSTAPDVFKVKFETTAGDFVVEVHKDWAPLGADRFFQLCKEGFYNNTAFFRVIPGFVAQFGLAADPAVTAQWESQRLQDDPVKQTNAPGTITFATAGPNTRTTQLFINYGNNKNLDGMGFSPFGKVVEGMESVNAISSKYGERPQQGLVTSQGDEYISKFFPDITKIKNVIFLK